MSEELVKKQTYKAATMIPDHIWKLTQHYHDLFELKKHWEMNGVPCPDSFTKELQRSHDLMLEALDEEWSQGGEYRKTAERKANETR